MPDDRDPRQLLDQFKLPELFVERLGWDRHKAELPVRIDDHEYTLRAVAQKRGFVAFTCEGGAARHVPDHHTRGRIDTQVTKSVREHLIIYTNADHSEQLWQWVRRAPGQPIARREYSHRRGQRGGMLIERVLPNIAFQFQEEDKLSLVEVTTRAKAGFDVEKVTKRFYDRFKTEHEAFSKFLKGIPDESLQSWYVSVLLNRLMFIYFIQKKRFLNGDADYLRGKLDHVQRKAKDRYYRDFLCPLFFEGFAKDSKERSPQVKELLGHVPFLNGGLFLRHQIEESYGEKIQIADAAFQNLFAFFDAYRWHLDERPLRENDEINPDVLGYIFEKYINQKQMGAYYTKEDITGYIAQNTIIPFLFDAACKDCAIAFKLDSAVWRLLREQPDRYIYGAVQRGVIAGAGEVIPESVFPDFVQKGMHDTKARMFEKRYNLGQATIADPDGHNLALPTETWREYVARRLRCLELRDKLRNGEVHEINDLITLNLDIRQFAEDVIATSEGPELVRAFWKAVERVTVLDPTCGSGAFLFAALNILEPLYEACLNRMQGFLDDLERVGKKHHPEKFSDFRKVLDRIAQHPNHRYFVLKSIMVNNLFGVDIMEEATEICKLRLFLKLVAQIERAEDIEPLPDIDFNIRAGNTLVGFASLDDVRRAITSEGDQQRLVFDDTLIRIEEQARLVDTAFRAFREMQTEQGVTPAELADGKEMIRSRMTALDAQLDRYLAAEYGVSSGNIPDKNKYDDAFTKWRKTHEPFHWFVDFYGIMSAGGFDVIIGNPPWAEYSTVKKTYTVRNYQTERSGNLHALCTERSLTLRSPRGSFSFIVQLPLANSSRMDTTRSVLCNGSRTLYVLPFDDRPGKLFDGLQHCRSVIFISRRTPETNQTEIFVNRYQRWATEVRETLFQGFVFTEVQRPLLFEGHFPKFGSSVERTAFRKVALHSKSNVGGSLSTRPSKNFVFYQEATGYWVKAVVGLPYYAKNGCVGEPAHGRFLYFNDVGPCHALMALLNSSLFYAYFIAYGDCFHLSDTLATHFPVPPSLFMDPTLVGVGRKLDRDLRANAEQMTISTKGGAKITYDEFFAWKSKRIIDEIDCLLANHYGCSNEELDFIINYDIKYRMGGSADNDDAQ